MTEHDRAPNRPGQFEVDRDEDGARPERRPASQSGLDSRKRGWYWHWNEIITQYAPLIGLKGIGLLNSYTAWTDRRDNSPHRGYAFPSQQTEGAFYGEDRAELITINKILVALDLVEIRKEMVQRTDEQGHNWRVPHNFYRVKDRTGGLTLTAADVIRVVELADRDKAVYRYLRRLFSPKFKPIDRDNVWHAILDEIAGNPTWRKLTERAAGQEARASARSRAGHKKRPKKHQPRDESDTELTSGQQEQHSLDDTEQAPDEDGQAATSVDTDNRGSPPDVDGSNSGFEEVVAPGNNGSTGNEVTIDDRSNKGGPGNVEQSNTMYYQEATTTTTTTNTDQSGTGPEPEHARSESASTDGESWSSGDENDTDDTDEDQQAKTATPLEPPSWSIPFPDSRAADLQSQSSPDRGTAPERDTDNTGGAGPLGDPSPLVVSLFEAANNRRSSPLERVLLSELERDADSAARAAGSTGSGWVAAALREAVASGSSFVAPKRIREIITRWSGGGRGTGGRPVAATSASPNEQAGASTRARSANGGANRGDPDIVGVWESTLKSLARSLDQATFRRLLSSSAILEQSSNSVSVRVESVSAADKLSREYRPMVERALGRELGRPVSVHFVTDDPQAPDRAPAPREGNDDTIVVSPADREQGRQLWQTIIDELRPTLPPDDLSRMRGVVPLGQNEAGELVLGMPNQFVQQLVGTRYRGLVEEAVSSVLGTDIRIHPLGQSRWSVSD